MTALSGTDLLNDMAALEAADPHEMLPAIASGAAQVRQAALLAAEAGVAALADEGRPRSIVVCGMGGSAIAGDILAAVTGPGSPVQVVTHRGYGLPGWVGAADLVVAVSCSGSTEETLSALDEAVRRGCRLLVVGAVDSPVWALGERGRAVLVPATQGRQPRASVWSLSTPLVIAAHALGLVQADEAVVEATAVQLEQVALRCRVDADHFANPAKTLALELADALPVIWGTSALAGTAAYRFACQLNENAKIPAVWGVLPEANHNQVVAFDGPFADGSPSSSADLFADRGDDVERTRFRLVLLRDSEEHPQVRRRTEVSIELARERGVEVSTVMAEGRSSFERLASLVGVTDWASAYLALLEGRDPTPVEAITALKRRIAP
ncbi:MAG: bifunctional phosphoglucose/phosphomannose isomerase [Mycobacteriales bacterium]